MVNFKGKEEERDFRQVLEACLEKCGEATLAKKSFTYRRHFQNQRFAVKNLLTVVENFRKTRGIHFLNLGYREWQRRKKERVSKRNRSG